MKGGYMTSVEFLEKSPLLLQKSAFGREKLCFFHGFAMENVSETFQNNCFPLEISVFEGITSKISRLRRLYNGGFLFYLVYRWIFSRQFRFGIHYVFSLSTGKHNFTQAARRRRKNGFLEAKTSIFEVINTRYTSKINQKAYKKLRRRRDFFLDLMIF